MLDIIITHHREPWEVCRGLFETLAAQRRVDWNQIRVTVVNDGGYILPPNFLLGLPFRVKQYNKDQGGVSSARNYGLDVTWRPWVMFCDCDDCFSNVFALEDIMSVLKDKYDMMWTKVWEEEKGQVYQIQDVRIMVFIHGKIYRRAFLEEQYIRFDEGLSFNEDSLFNATVMARTTKERIGEISCHYPPYVWIRREGSVTGGNDADDRSAWGQFLRNMRVAEEIREHKPEQYPGMVTRMAYDVFFMQMSSRFTPSCKQKLLEAFRPWIRERIGDFGKVDEQTLRKIRDIDCVELLAKEDRPDIEPETVAWWVKGMAK